MFRVALALALTFALTTGLRAQPAAAYQESAAAFAQERAAALKVGAGDTDLAAADELAARAADALAGGDAAKAVRLLREARWAVPPATTNRDGVARTFGGGRFRQGDRVTGVSFSPDGRRLATASRDGTVKVWDLDNGRELLTYRGHDTDPPDAANVFRVPAVAFAPDGKSVASSGGKVLHLWDAATGKLLTKFAGHAGPARGLAFTPDGKSLVSGGDDRRVIVWDIAAGKPRVKYPEQSNRVEGVAAGAGKWPGRLVAAVNASGELLFYPVADVPKAQLSGSTVTEGGVGAFAVAFVGERSAALTAGGDGKVKLTVGPDPDVAAGQVAGGVGTVTRTFTGHTGAVQDLAATPDGRRFVSGGADRTVRVWETATGKPLAVFTSAALATPADVREVGVTAVDISADGQYVAAGTVEGRLHLWPVAPDDESRRNADAAGPVWAVAVSPSGKLTAAAGADRSVRLYDTATGKLQATLAGHAAAVPALAFAGETLLASGSGDRLVKLWDTAAGTATDLAGHTSAVLAVAASAKTGRIFSGSLDKTVRAWDRAGKPLWAWPAGSAVTALAARPDGTRLAVGTADGTLTVLDVPESGEPARVGGTIGHTAGVSALAFHPDGRRVLSCGGDGLGRLWAVKDGAAPAVLARFETESADGTPPPTARGVPAPPAAAKPAPALAAAAFAPDGTLFALGGADGVVRLWSTDTRKELRRFRGPTDWVSGLAFAADGRSVLAACADKSLRRFDVPRAEADAGRGHTGAVQAVAVSPDGKRLATGGRDSLVKIWSLADGELQLTLTGSAASVNAMGFVSDDTLATTGSDGQVRWWSLTGPAAGRELRAAPTPPGLYNFSLHADRKTGRVACVGGQANQSVFYLFDADGKSLAQLPEPGRTLSCANISGDLALVATAAKDGVVRLWDLPGKARVGADWDIGKVDVIDLDFTPDNSKLLVIDADGLVRIATIDGRTVGDPIPGNPGPKGLVLAAAAADRFGIFCDDGTVKTYTLAGEPLKTWKLPAPVTSLTFTPAGDPVAGLSDGAAVVLK